MTVNVQPSMEDRASMAGVVFGVILPQAIYAAARLRLADLLASGPKTAAELAAEAPADPHSVYRLLRFLASNGIFVESDGERFELNARGQLLRSDVPGSVLPIVLFLCDPVIWTSLGKFVDSIQQGKTAFQLAHGISAFEYLNEHPELFAIFDAAMTQRRDHTAIARAYDFGGCQLVVDVGGGSGATLLEVLKSNDTVRGVLFDLPQVVERAKETIEGAGLGSRCQIVGGSFFDSVPEGGDLYLMEDILHDWDDPSCLKILSTCRSAMGRGARLLIAERVLPAKGASAQVLRIDLLAMALAGGMERTEAGYRGLLEKTGFSLERVIRVSPVLGLVEASTA